MLHHAIVAWRRKAAVAALFGAACLSQPLPAGAEEYVVGVITPRSGPAQPIGQSMRNGIALALEEAEDKGRFREGVSLSLQDYDDNQPAAELAKRTERLVHDNDAILLIGPLLSSQAEVMAATANRYSFPMLSPGVSEGISAMGPWSFRSGVSPYRLIESMTRDAIESTKARKIAVVYPEGNAGFQSQAKTIAGVADQMRRLVAAEVALPEGDESFEAVAGSLATVPADLIFICMDAEPAGVLASRLSKSGVPANRLVFTPSAASPALLEVGREFVEGALVATDYLPELAGSQNEEFVASYRQRYGKAPDRWAGIGYATGLIAAEAIRAAGPAPTRQLVRDGMERLTKVTVPLGDGTWTLQLRHEPQYGPAFFRIRGGAFAPVSSTAAK